MTVFIKNVSWILKGSIWSFTFLPMNALMKNKNYEMCIYQKFHIHRSMCQFPFLLTVGLFWKVVVNRDALTALILK